MIEFFCQSFEKKKKNRKIEKYNTIPMTIEQFSGMHACDCLFFFFFFLGVAITQDYTEEFRDIAKGSKSKEALPAGSITLINQRPVGEDVHVKFCYVLHYTIRGFRLHHLPRYEDSCTHMYKAHKKGNRASFFFFLPIDNHEITSKLANTTRSPRMGFLFQLLVRLT